MSDYGPEFDAYAKRVRDEVVPMMQDSAFFLSITPGSPDQIDVKFATEMGLAILLDKPILAMISAGSKVSKKLAMVVDKFVEIDDISSQENKQRLMAAITEMTQELDQ